MHAVQGVVVAEEQTSAVVDRIEAADMPLTLVLRRLHKQIAKTLSFEIGQQMTFANLPKEKNEKRGFSKVSN